jgi:hypothetical protein
MMNIVSKSDKDGNMKEGIIKDPIKTIKELF